MDTVKVMSMTWTPTPTVEDQARHALAFETWLDRLATIFVFVFANRLVTVIRSDNTSEAWRVLGMSVALLIAPSLASIVWTFLRKRVVQKICPGYDPDLAKMLQKSKKESSSTKLETFLIVTGLIFVCLFKQSSDIFAVACFVIFGAELVFIFVYALLVIFDDIWQTIQFAVAEFNDGQVRDYLAEYGEQTP